MTNLSTDLHDVEKIIVLDYGSQYNQLISRRIREIGVFSELKSNKISAAEVKEIKTRNGQRFVTNLDDVVLHEGDSVWIARKFEMEHSSYR